MKLSQVQETEGQLIKKEFWLSAQPDSYALSIHFNNLFKYFSEENKEFRISIDQSHTMSVSYILDLVRLLCHSDMLCDQYILMRQYSPVEFRISQLISFYGNDYVLNYLNLIYGETHAEVV